jgi:hypothetical protein
MGALKQLHASDISVTNYVANKKWIFSYLNTPNDSYITYYIGKNEPYSSNGSVTTNNEYQSSMYNLVNQLYYQSYTASLNTSSLASSKYYESASEYRPTSSYYKYNGVLNNFPSSSGDQIGILGISPDLYGNNILPYSFKISSSAYTIVDDGLGNLYDVSYVSSSYIDNQYVNPFYVTQSLNSGSILVGNIFYSQGNCIITNYDYINILRSINSSSINNLFSGSYAMGDQYPYVYNSSQNHNLIYASGSITNTGDKSGFVQIVASDGISDSILFQIDYPNFLVGQTYDFFISSSLPNGSQFIINSFYNDNSEANFVLYSYTTVSVFNKTHVEFTNNYNIYENEIKCNIKESEFGLTYNPTIQTGSNGLLKESILSSSFSPYTTSVGLYNNNQELLAVAKLSKPILISPDTDMTFIIKYDL